MVNVNEVEQRTDLVKASAIEVGTTLGGVLVSTVADLAKISDTLSRGKIAVPAHCRNEPGVCFALAMQALEWGLPIMSVITKSYLPRNADRLGYESQLIHAVIEKNAPLKNRLRYEIIGEGDERRCKVSGTFRGEDKPHEYTSETLAKMHPGHVTKTIDGEQRKFVRGSQLWDDTPEVQMFYSASRTWARLFAPDVLLGAYTPDEIEKMEPVDVTPITSLANRLRDAKMAHAGEGRGFDAAHIAQAGASVIEGEAQSPADKEASDDGEQRGVDVADGDGRAAQPEDRGDDPHDEGRGGQAVGAGETVRGAPAGAAVRDEGQAEGEGQQPARPAPKPRPRRK
ncbi:MAG TPA: recombinase RecT [Casimicrobiaceae bacterium]|jgi:RecT family|nr:recombinase RecT [Casimicrobiaceae bacterium]